MKEGGGDLGLGGAILVNGHGIDGVQIAGDFLEFADSGVDGGMEAMVILRGKSKDGDMTIMFRQFLVINQLGNGKLGALDRLALKHSQRNQKRASLEAGKEEGEGGGCTLIQ
jgi:hypothetical protein